MTLFSMGPTLLDYFPEIKQNITIATFTDVVRYGDIALSECYHLADPAIFEMLTFPLVIALFTVGSQAIKEVLTNPVEVLRYE